MIYRLIDRMSPIVESTSMVALLPEIDNPVLVVAVKPTKWPQRLLPTPLAFQKSKVASQRLVVGHKLLSSYFFSLRLNGFPN